MSANADERLLLREEAGWLGTFTREQAAGALPNGTTIVKVNSQPGDFHANGTLGTVIGSVGEYGAVVFYFIEWAPRPRCAVGTLAYKVKAAP